MGKLLPFLGQLGKGGEARGICWRRQEMWKILHTETRKEKEELTPYSFMHRFVYYCHNRTKKNGIFGLTK